MLTAVQACALAGDSHPPVHAPAGRLPAENIVKANTGAGGVRYHGCGICHPTARWGPAAIEAVGVSGVRIGKLFSAAGHPCPGIRASARNSRASTGGGDDAVAFGDNAAGETGTAGDVGDVWFAFGLVGVEQRVWGLAVENGGELPA